MTRILLQFSALFLNLILICALFSSLADAVKVINNGLAPPEIVHTPLSTKPRCSIRAPPLDLVFVLDSSGSLKNKFQDEIDVIRRIVRHVTIGESATRVMLIQFSGVQHLEFDFNKFTTRAELLDALDVLRHVSGITRVGGAFEFALSVFTPERGMRGANVPKILYLLSDGRTHDFPKDSEMAETLRRVVPNLELWAYGTGEYVAMSELLKITRDESKIITNKNLDRLEGLFNQWHGTEVCETQPVCVKGSDKPLDMVLVIDSSESILKVFREQISFVVDRVLQNVHVHPDAVRVGLITFSGQAYVHFGLNDLKYGNNSAVADYLHLLRPIKGTTSMNLALQAAFEMLTDTTPQTQVRASAQKLILLVTDGRSARSSHTIALRIHNERIPVLAVSVNYPANTDEAEMRLVAGQPDHVFTSRNIQEFEQAFLKYVGFGCAGLTLGPESTPRVRGATDVSCGADALTFTVRTQRPMSGRMYASEFQDDPRCGLQANGNSRELTITFTEGYCGLIKTPSAHFDGYNFNITVILQFHPLIVTRADQGLDVTCFHAQRISPAEAQRVAQRKLIDAQCTYRIHRFGVGECMALDAKVGESLFHKWHCDDLPPNYRYLVHDCYASSERQNVLILDSNGCEVDAHFLETPNYARAFAHTAAGGADANRSANLNGVEDDDLDYVFQEMSAFKFPGDNNVVFRCRISFCDMFSNEKCAQMIPPKCSVSSAGAPNENTPRIFEASEDDTVPKFVQRRHVQRSISQSQQQVGGKPLSTSDSSSNFVGARTGFARTITVETRTLNVIDNEAIRPQKPVRYCDVRN